MKDDSLQCIVSIRSYKLSSFIFLNKISSPLSYLTYPSLPVVIGTRHSGRKDHVWFHFIHCSLLANLQSFYWLSAQIETSWMFCPFEGERTKSMADWMSELPIPARDKPLMTLAIPGMVSVHLTWLIEIVYLSGFKGKTEVNLLCFFRFPLKRYLQSERKQWNNAWSNMVCSGTRFQRYDPEGGLQLVESANNVNQTTGIVKYTLGIIHTSLKLSF